jgi:ribonuclease HI
LKIISQKIKKNLQKQQQNFAIIAITAKSANNFISIYNNRSKSQMSLYKDKLHSKVLALETAFRKHDIQVFVDDSSFGDYSVTIALSKNNLSFGKFSIYYKPSKETYSFKSRLTDDCAVKLLEAMWDEINGFETYTHESGIYEAFVDGSYISGVSGYGAVIYLGDVVQTELFGIVPQAKSRQIDGEFQSVIETLKWCKNNGVKRIRINYDYQGIENFATGVWKAGSEIAKKYVDFINENEIELEWRKINSHTGNFKNNKADFLARKAAADNLE